MTDSLIRHYRLGQSVIRAVEGVSLSVKKGEFAALLDLKVGQTNADNPDCRPPISAQFVAHFFGGDRHAYLSHQVSNHSQEGPISGDHNHGLA